MAHCPNFGGQLRIRVLQAGKLQVAARLALFVEYEAAYMRAEHVLAAGLAQQDAQDFLDQLASLVAHSGFFLCAGPARQAGCYRPHLEPQWG